MVNFRIILIDFGHGLVDSIRGLYFVRRVREEESKEVVYVPPEPKERAVLQMRREKQGIFRRPPEPPTKKDSFLKKLGMIYLMNGAFLLLWQFCIYLFGFLFGIFNRDYAIYGYNLGYFLSIPIFLASRIVQALWFSDISGACMRTIKIQTPHKVSFDAGFGQTAVAFTHTVIFLFQTILSAYLPIPIITPFIFHVHMALLNSMYSFDYLFEGLNLPFLRRREYFESHWPYFIGFGTPLALACSLCSQWFVSGAVFAVLFPLFIISSYPANWNRKYEERIPPIAFCRISYMLTQIVGQYVRYNTRPEYQIPPRQSMATAAK